MIIVKSSSDKNLALGSILVRLIIPQITRFNRRCRSNHLFEAMSLGVRLLQSNCLFRSRVRLISIFLMLTGFAPLKLIDSKMDAVMKSDCNLVFECHPIRLSFGLNSILTN